MFNRFFVIWFCLTGRELYLICSRCQYVSGAYLAKAVPYGFSGEIRRANLKKRVILTLFA